MPYERAEYPEFSWSYSRSEKLRDCPRKYYYHYYASHNGWEDDAPENARLAYRLKKLTSFPLEIGDAVHRAASVAIRRARHSASLPTEDELYSIVFQQLHTVWRQSHDRPEWERSPTERKMFREFYYELGPIADRRDQIRSCLRNLLRSGSFRGALTAPDIVINDDKRFDKFEVDGLSIYAVPDLVYIAADGLWMIVDWKSGYSEHGGREQTLVYALYIHLRYEIPLSQIRARVESLADGYAEDHVFTEDDLRICIAAIGDSITEMKTYLGDPSLNAPLERERFPLRWDTSTCQYCEFYELDQREIGVPVAAPSLPT